MQWTSEGNISFYLRTKKPALIFLVQLEGMLPYIYIYIYNLGKTYFQNAPHFSVFFPPQIRACLSTEMKSTLHKKGEFCCPIGSSDFRWVLPFLFVLMHCHKFAEISPFAKRKIQLVSLRAVMSLLRIQAQLVKFH
jgi:hypothetical protein